MANAAIIARMVIEQIFSMIDVEIARLRQARDLLAIPGRAISQTKKPKPAVKKSARKKRRFSREGLERLRKAATRRWQELKKAGVKSPHLAKLK